MPHQKLKSQKKTESWWGPCELWALKLNTAAVIFYSDSMVVKYRQDCIIVLTVQIFTTYTQNMYLPCNILIILVNGNNQCAIIFDMSISTTTNNNNGSETNIMFLLMIRMNNSSSNDSLLFCKRFNAVLLHESFASDDDLQATSFSCFTFR